MNSTDMNSAGTSSAGQGWTGEGTSMDVSTDSGPETNLDASRSDAGATAGASVGFGLGAATDAGIDSAAPGVGTVGSGGSSGLGIAEMGLDGGSGWADLGVEEFLRGLDGLDNAFVELEDMFPVAIAPTPPLEAPASAPSAAAGGGAGGSGGNAFDDMMVDDMECAKKGDPIALLVSVAKAIVSGDQARVHQLLSSLNDVASVYGTVTQRLSAYFLEGLIARVAGAPPKHSPNLFHRFDASSGVMGRFGGEERAGGAERGEEEECREGRGNGAGFGQGYAAAGGDVGEQGEAFLDKGGPFSDQGEQGGPFLEQGEQGGRPFEQRQEAGELTPDEAALISSRGTVFMPGEATGLVVPPPYRGVPAPVSPPNVDCNRTLLESFQVLVNATPFLTFGQVAANSAILEALADEPRVHIIDFGIGHALQWPALLQALGARPGGPPHVRVTGIEVPQCGAMSPYCAMKAGKRLEVSRIVRVLNPPHVRVTGIEVPQCGAMSPYCAVKAGKRLEALGARPGGAPHVRVTGIEVPQCGAMSPYCAMKAGKRLEVSRIVRVLNPPHVRVTGIEVPLCGAMSPYCAMKAGKRLDRRASVRSHVSLLCHEDRESAAAMWGVPLRYHWVMSRLEDVTPSMLNLHPGEAIAANCALRLSQLLDESEQPNAAANPATAASTVFAKPVSEPAPEPVSEVAAAAVGADVDRRADVDGAYLDRSYLDGSDSNRAYLDSSDPDRSYLAKADSDESPRTRVLRTIRMLRPKVVTVVEQYSNHSSPFFLARFYEALYYYAALFESIDASLPRNEVARRVFEEQVLGRAIVNLVACEGQERVERQEPLEQWQQRMLRAGFKPRGLSEGVVTTLHALLQTYNKVGHDVRRVDEASVVLTWKGNPLLAMMAWEPQE
ncbi:unnamed protein product [Closterium sp. NIES-64]|nr:unnamed protein product [Closterium sp. NIES-64]